MKNKEVLDIVFKRRCINISKNRKAKKGRKYLSGGELINKMKLEKQEKQIKNEPNFESRLISMTSIINTKNGYLGNHKLNSHRKEQAFFTL